MGIRKEGGRVKTRTIRIFDTATLLTLLQVQRFSTRELSKRLQLLHPQLPSYSASPSPFPTHSSNPKSLSV